MNFVLFRPFPHVWYALLAIFFVATQAFGQVAPPAAVSVSADARNLNEWLMRLNPSSTNRSYIGTFVVSANGSMSSAKIWHVWEGSQQAERVETLTGPRRSIFRHGNQVTTYLPELNVVRSEKRESLGLFPDLFQAADSRVGEYYQFQLEGVERVAGVDADVAALRPRDGLRFGYRVWTERKSGLVVKLQTLDVGGKVVEQAAFSELQLDAPVRLDKLVQMMNRLDGYKVEKPVLVKTTASAEGWLLKAPVAGFNAVNFYRRPGSADMGAAQTSPADGPMQWVFSDGLASVSIFIELLDRQRHVREAMLSLGATQTMTRRLDPYWITLVGEVPIATLQLFANGLERRK